MAIYIPLYRIEQAPDYVIYRFGRDVYAPDPVRPKRRQVVATLLGRVRVDIRSGEVTRLEGADWDTEDFYFSRVCRVLARCWKARDFPPETSYAA